MTSTIGLCMLDFWGSSNVLLLVHFESIYQQMKLLGCIQVPIDVELILASSNTPILNYEFSDALEWSIDIYLFLQAQTPSQMKLLEGIQLVNKCR